MSFEHETVLLRETIDLLQPQPSGVYVDCTLGGGGHAEYLLSLLGEDGHLYAFDQDKEALQNAEERLGTYIDQGKLTLIHANFRHIQEELLKQGVQDVDGIYYDLGVSSPQLDHGERGFSYWKDAQLDMRMNQEQALTAEEIVNTWSFEDLVRIISRYGEERFAKRIARAIEQQREKAPITSTLKLAEIVKEAIPAATRRTGGHPAKRTFQAVRIAVNDELGALEESVTAGLELLKVGGRMSVISFHSLEDRFVKQIFREKSKKQTLPANLPILPEDIEQPEFKLITRKAITASPEELADNNRSRSALLRVIERQRPAN